MSSLARGELRRRFQLRRIGANNDRVAGGRRLPVTRCAW